MLGEMSYIAHAKSTADFELSLSIIEKDELTIDIEIAEISSKDNSEKFITSVKEIAAAINSTSHLICPEFEKHNAFYIDGEFV